MRNTLLFLLAASVSMPALAADEPGDRAVRRAEARAERAEARAERQAQRAEPQQQTEAQAPAEVRQQHREVIREQVFERRLERNRGGESVRPTLEQRTVERRSEAAPDATSAQPVVEQRVIERRSARRLGNGDFVRPMLEERAGSADTVSEWRSRERRIGDAPAAIGERQGSAGIFQQPREQARGRDSIGNRRAPIVSRIAREGTQPPQRAAVRSSRYSGRHWDGNWRNDRRHDWRRHRDRHRSLFRFGFYYDPFGWSYRPYSIGWRLWPSYYQSRYWLSDPGMYRLPYAPPGYRWIRYYDDALLVDTWDGTVVDVIYNFFW